MITNRVELDLTEAAMVYLAAMAHYKANEYADPRYHADVLPVERINQVDYWYGLALQLDADTAWTRPDTTWLSRVGGEV